MLNRKVIKILFLSATGFVLSLLAVNVFALSINGKNFVEFKRNPKVDFSTDFAQKVTECNDRSSCSGIILPAGSFFLNKPIGINNGISITGAGAGKTILNIGYDLKSFVFNGGANSDDLELKGLTLNFTSANKIEKIGAVNIRNAKKLTLDDLEIINSPYVAISISGSTTDKTICSGLKLQNIKVRGTGTTTANGVNISGCSNIFIDNLEVSGAKKDGVFLNGVSSTTVINSNLVNNLANALEFNSSDKILISNSTTSNSQSGLQLTGTTTGLVIIKSIIQNNEKHGIFLNSKTLTGFNISSNIISGNASTGLFISGGEDIVIFGNFLRQNSENGLLIANSRNIIVDGNKFEGNKNIGISLSKATSFILIKNNSILDTGLNSSTTDKFKSIAVNMASGTSNVTFKNNLVKNLSATVLTDVGLKIDAGVQKVFVNDNTFASSTKDIIVGTNTRKVCIYNDPKMLRWQKLLCWIQEFLNYSFKI